MRKPIVLLALLVVLAGTAVVNLSRSPLGLSASELEALVDQPLDSHARRTPEDARPFWRALLESPAATTADGVTTLRLGRVLADPTAARGSAESAGGLLALEAEDPASGPLGVPLWRAIVDGPSTHGEDGRRVLALYGCRHSGDADSAPNLEDTYEARLALADALAVHLAGDPELDDVEISGREMPVRGGVNFEVVLRGEHQSVVVTFDGHAAPVYQARRVHRPDAPNDALARRHLVEALRRSLGGEGLVVEGEDAPVDGGVDVRIERSGTRLAIVAMAGEQRLSTHVDLGPGDASSAPSPSTASDPATTPPTWEPVEPGPRP